MNRMMSMTSRIGDFTHDSEVVVGPDGFSRPLSIMLGIESRSRVVIYALEHVLLILGAMKPWNGAFLLDS